jgi:hypothetical protein
MATKDLIHPIITLGTPQSNIVQQLQVDLNYLNLISFSYKSNPYIIDILENGRFSIPSLPSFKKIQEANIDALAEVVGKDKAEKVFLAVRDKKNQDEKGGGEGSL